MAGRRGNAGVVFEELELVTLGGGRVVPILSNHSSMSGILAFHSSTSTATANSMSAGGVLIPFDVELVDPIFLTRAPRPCPVVRASANGFARPPPPSGAALLSLTGEA
jgi:hypothetical protein